MFILTTNRADLLEAALAARPGRIDQAIEIKVPEAEGRGALLDLYLGERVEDASRDAAIERTAGAAASYIKEIARRAVLGSIRSGDPLSVALVAAVDDLATNSTPLLRAALAAAGPTEPGSHQLDA